ncbi:MULTISPECIES: hypothetical protein [Sphingomonas]|uniref:Heme exporter protein D n=1 Tax=Sphingomonas kyungheensis TaxID=1069987 RepID=A0ABU8H334_9SPHN|nr:hypothetical protein [Sphingomonas sp. CV7422]
MKGWTAVVVITGLALVMLIGLNVRLWRMMKAATAKAREQQARGESPPPV